MKKNMVLWLSTLSIAMTGVQGRAHAEETRLILEVLAGSRVVTASSFSQSLYVFDPDLKSDAPTCEGTCAEKWPPYVVTEQEASQLPPGFATVPRNNGLLQVTLNARPLYLFYLDRRPGDLLGDGLGGVWHAVPVVENR